MVLNIKSLIFYKITDILIYMPRPFGYKVKEETKKKDKSYKRKRLGLKPRFL